MVIFFSIVVTGFYLLSLNITKLTCRYHISRRSINQVPYIALWCNKITFPSPTLLIARDSNIPPLPTIPKTWWLRWFSSCDDDDSIYTIELPKAIKLIWRLTDRQYSWWIRVSMLRWILKYNEAMEHTFPWFRIPLLQLLPVIILSSSTSDVVLTSLLNLDPPPPSPSSCEMVVPIKEVAMISVSYLHCISHKSIDPLIELIPLKLRFQWYYHC